MKSVWFVWKQGKLVYVAESFVEIEGYIKSCVAPIIIIIEEVKVNEFYTEDWSLKPK